MGKSIDQDLKKKITEVLAQRKKLVIKDSNLKSAAVLVVLFEKSGEYHVLFTQRTQIVEYHKGEVSFPGGTCDEEDENLLATALRESLEEIGLQPKDVEILGELDDTVTISDFVVSPFVAVIPHPYEFKLSATEVERLIEVPLSALLDRSNFREEIQFRDGKPHQVCFYSCGGNVIWGATARILKNFLDSVFPGEIGT